MNFSRYFLLETGMNISLHTMGAIGLSVICIASASAADPTTVNGLGQKDARELATRALQAEADGDFLTRQRLQREALQAQADCPLVKMQQGEIYVGSNQWRSIEDCIQLAALSDSLKLYELRRGSSQLNANQHFALGRWCLSHQLGPQAIGHFNRVIQLEPDHMLARTALGYQRFGSEWISPEEILEMRQRAQLLQRSVAMFGKSLKQVYSKLQNENPRVREQAQLQLDGLTDPTALPAVENVFSDAPLPIALKVVEWMERVSTIESSQALARYALLHPAGAVRAAATDALRVRPLHEFAPQLVAMSVSPVQSMLMPVLNPDGTLAGYRQAFAQESANENRLLVVDTAFERFLETLVMPSSASQNAENTVVTGVQSAQVNQMNQLIEQAVMRKSREEAVMRQATMQRDNAVIAMRNQRIAALLSDVTDEEIVGTAQGIWQWWDKWNDAASQLSKERRVQRTMLTHSIPRYQAVQEVGVPEFSVPQYSEEEWASMERQRRRAATLRASGSGAFPRGECLVAGTKVLTHRGKRDIETIRTGDLVLTRSIDTGALFWKPVIRATTRPAEPIKHIETSDDQLRCTKGHLFWVSGKGWVKARDLKPGDVLHGAKEPTVIHRITDSPAQPTFNLIVADNSNYFVGDELVLTHDLTEREATRIRVPGLADLTAAP